MFKMKEAFLMYVKGAETFDFTFRYVQSDLKVDKQFFFSEKVNENVEHFLKKLDVKMRKPLQKQKKTRTGKKDPNIVLEQVDNVGNGKIFMLRGNEKVQLDQSCKTIIDDPGELFFIIFNEKYLIRYNAPWIKGMELPTCILVGYPVYPVFDAINTDKGRSKFRWFRCKEEKYAHGEQREWKQVSEGPHYVPDKSDIGCRIKVSCTPCNEWEEGTEVETDSQAVQSVPEKFPFELRHAFTRNKLCGKDFRITSYNILADIYADSDHAKNVTFRYCPPYALAIDYRKLLIIKELSGYNSDLICLQEVSTKFYRKELVPASESLNYGGIFRVKWQKREGTAIFYDKKRFKMIDNKSMVIGKSIKYNDVFLKIWRNIKNKSAKQRFLEMNTTLQIVTLESLENSGEILVVGNTHLYFHPDADHIRLLQGYFALTECQHAVKNIKKKHKNKNVTLILAGDLNSRPTDGIYELMTKKYIPEDHKSWSSNAEQVIKNVSLTHKMSLASACGTPQYTNFTVDFADCLDYIFYETDKLEVTQIIPMPTKEELSLHTAIPSVVFPSDHIPICADMRWKE